MSMAENVQRTALCSILTNYETKMSDCHHSFAILLYQLIYLFILKHKGRENSLYYVLQNLVENATPLKFQKISFAPVADAVAPPHRSQTI